MPQNTQLNITVVLDECEMVQSQNSEELEEWRKQLEKQEKLHQKKQLLQQQLLQVEEQLREHNNNQQEPQASTLNGRSNLEFSFVEEPPPYHDFY